MIKDCSCNYAVRRLPSADTNGGDFVVDRYGQTWRQIPYWQRGDGTADRYATIHADGRITEP